MKANNPEPALAHVQGSKKRKKLQIQCAAVFLLKKCARWHAGDSTFIAFRVPMLGA